MSNLNFESFTRKIFLHAPIETIYRAWATPSGICKWFLSQATYEKPDGQFRSGEECIEIGDRYLWKWHNWEGEERGEILSADGRSALSFTFAGGCRVSVKLEEAEGAVLLTLVQDRIPQDEKSLLEIHHGCSNGWSFWLANLKAYLEFGVLLHETAHDLRADPMAGFEFVNL